MFFFVASQRNVQTERKLVWQVINMYQLDYNDKELNIFYWYWEMKSFLEIARNLKRCILISEEEKYMLQGDVCIIWQGQGWWNLQWGAYQGWIHLRIQIQVLWVICEFQCFLVSVKRDQVYMYTLWSISLLPFHHKYAYICINRKNAYICTE